ncbi:MAG: hypothetical protein IK017_06175 [Paludibacteraceae bacterium]|nr:hypothetical protein [Paludibacteraceae bacterium]MBR5972222.1 hypothetical protein [Paludibacteraceae bacterium]
MVYKFVILSDEVDDFVREIDIDSEATFMELHDAILESVGYANDQMTSFFICDDDWETGTEITQVEMDTASDVDSYVMDKTKLYELVSDEGQRLVFVFDYMNNRSFYMELKSIITSNDLPKAVCKISKGKAPAQVLDGLFMDDAAISKKDSAVFDDGGEDFLDGEGFNEDELDGLSINDNYFEE